MADTDRLWDTVVALRTELHRAHDCLEQAHHEIAKQKRLTELTVSGVVCGLSDKYAGYENGKVIYRWEAQRREQEANRARDEAIRFRLEAVRQATQQKQEETLRAKGLGGWVEQLRKSSARRRLI